MDDGEKALLVVFASLFALFALIGTVILAANLRWRANTRDFIKSGYTQRQAATTYKTIWVKDVNEGVTK